MTGTGIHARLWIGLLLVAMSGCAGAFLGAGEFLGSVGDGLATIGTCLSPLAPVDLNAAFARAPAVAWADGAAEVTDAAQNDVQEFLGGQLGECIEPVEYGVLRLYQLGPLSSGEVVQVEPLRDFAGHATLYDADVTLIPGGDLRDFDGRLRTLQIPIRRDTASAYLRIDLDYLSERGEPIARLTRSSPAGPPGPRPQTVVLDFGGQDGVTFRNGSIVPARIGPLDAPAVRDAAVEQFRAVFAPFNLRVLTDADPPPAEPFSTIHIGPAELSLYNYGLAEIIDARNSYLDDVAVVDTNQPALELSRLFGPQTQGRALGMIAAHEMGHLLGLYHVADADALMTGVQCQGAGLDLARLLARRLNTAPLTLASADLRTWTLGRQDAVADLQDALGPAEGH